MMTVHEVSKISGVSIRALHYYDKIGLLPATEVSNAGYRLYDDTSLERLQYILLFKELEFSLKEIKNILDNPEFDQSKALEQQIQLLELRKEHLQNLIDLAWGIKMIGVKHMSFEAFDTKKIDEYAKRAKESWGKTEAYKEYEQKAAGRSKEEQQTISVKMMEIFAKFGKIKDQSPDGEAAVGLAKELQDFIARFAANASKSRQATSRKKELEKLTIADFKPSLRKYPFIDFKYEKEIGNDILMVEGLTKKGYFENVSFTVQRDEKIGIVSDKSTTLSMLYDVLTGKVQPDSGTVRWGKTISVSYFPENNNEYFQGCDLNLVQWLSQYSKDHYEEYLRGWLGRMLFSGEEALKEAKVLSGGEKVRCMLAKMMLEGSNFLIMDEPTNHLDLESITALNNGMKNFKGCMLFTSHDQELMNTVANRIIEINQTKKFDKCVNYDEYLDIITQ